MRYSSDDDYEAWQKERYRLQGEVEKALRPILEKYAIVNPWAYNCLNGLNLNPNHAPEILKRFVESLLIHNAQLIDQLVKQQQYFGCTRLELK